MSVLVETKQGFDIYFEPLEDDLSLDEVFDIGVTDLNEKINNYDLVYFCAHVWAEKNGIKLGEDYLGVCCYESYEDFYNKYHDDYFTDMVSRSINESKKMIEGLI